MTVGVLKVYVCEQHVQATYLSVNNMTYRLPINVKMKISFIIYQATDDVCRIV